MSNIYNQPAYGYAAINGTPQPGVLLTQFYVYVYDQTLTANQSLVNQALPINNDADFDVRAIAVALGSGFKFRISDSNNQQRFSDYVDSALLRIASIPVPFPMFPAITIPAGGKIGIDIVETAGVGTTVQLLFMGVKRFMAPAVVR
jgi:hypothetical protein